MHLGMFDNIKLGLLGSFQVQWWLMVQAAVAACGGDSPSKMKSAKRAETLRWKPLRSRTHLLNWQKSSRLPRCRRHCPPCRLMDVPAFAGCWRGRAGYPRGSVFRPFCLAKVCPCRWGSLPAPVGDGQAESTCSFVRRSCGALPTKAGPYPAPSAAPKKARARWAL